MVDYPKMYATLCIAIDNAIDPLEKIPAARQIAWNLRGALLEAENIYIESATYTSSADGVDRADTQRI